jgi:hypothetical protein
MNISVLAPLLTIYGIFLILCGIASVIFIGMKAKTALISGGTSGLIALTIAYFIAQQSGIAQIGGIVVSIGLFIIFSWRSTKTLFAIFELIPANSPDLKGKGVAFLIISLMAVISIFVSLIQLIYL